MAEGFEWDQINTRHIWRHRVRPHEAEEALADPHAAPVPVYDVGSLPRDAIIGMTVSGRLLYVVYEFPNGGVRVITARPPTTHEEPLYWRR